MRDFDFSQNPEMAKEVAKDILPSLINYNKELHPLILSSRENGKEVILENQEKIERWSTNGKLAHGLVSTLFEDRFKHDAAGKSTNMFADMELMAPRLRKGDIESFEEKRDSFLQEWDRYWVVLEDLLLRVISKEKVAEENVGELDVGMFERLTDFFENQEIARLIENDNEDDPSYKDLSSKNFVNEIDFEELKNKLGDKKIKGNNGLTYNFVLNSLRNALKDRIEADNVYLSAELEGDELVIGVMDDGKGVDSNALDESHEDFIFKSGSSRTESTGLGLAYAQDRIPSMGGDLNVVSRRKDEGGVNHYPPENDFDLDKINEGRKQQDKREVNTIFEIRLPLEDVK